MKNLLIKIENCEGPYEYMYSSGNFTRIGYATLYDEKEAREEIKKYKMIGSKKKKLVVIEDKCAVLQKFNENFVPGCAIFNGCPDKDDNVSLYREIGALEKVEIWRGPLRFLPMMRNKAVS